MGEESNKQRNLDTMELLNYGFANYKVDKVLSTKDYLGYINIKFGKKDKVKLTIKEDIYDLVNILDKNNYSYNLNIKEIKAPIKKGDVVGYVDIYANEVKTKTYPLTIVEDVNKGNFLNFLFRNINKYIKGTN